jgi:hypothetical protein
LARLSDGAGGRTRTDTPFGNGILSAARLPVPPRPHVVDVYSVKKAKATKIVKLNPQVRLLSPSPFIQFLCPSSSLSERLWLPRQVCF